MSYAQDMLCSFRERIEESNEYHVKGDHRWFCSIHKEKALGYHHEIVNASLPEHLTRQGIEIALIHFQCSSRENEYWLYARNKKSEVRLDVTLEEDGFYSWTTVEKGRFEWMPQYEEIKSWFYEFIQNLPKWRLYFVTGMTINEQGVSR